MGSRENRHDGFRPNTESFFTAAAGGSRPQKPPLFVGETRNVCRVPPLPRRQAAAGSDRKSKDGKDENRPVPITPGRTSWRLHVECRAQPKVPHEARLKNRCY